MTDIVRGGEIRHGVGYHGPGADDESADRQQGWVEQWMLENDCVGDYIMLWADGRRRWGWIPDAGRGRNIHLWVQGWSTEWFHNHCNPEVGTSSSDDVVELPKDLEKEIRISNAVRAAVEQAIENAMKKANEESARQDFFNKLGEKSDED